VDNWEEWEGDAVVPDLGKRGDDGDDDDSCGGGGPVGAATAADLWDTAGKMPRRATTAAAAAASKQRALSTAHAYHQFSEKESFIDSKGYLDYAKELTLSRPMLLVNAKLAVGSMSKSLTQAALHKIREKLRDTLHADFQPRVEAMFASGLCFHTDSSVGGDRAHHDQKCLETIFEGDYFVLLEYPPRYVGSSELANLWETATRQTPWCSVVMLVACIRECHHTLEWKAAMVEEVQQLALRQHQQIDKRHKAYSMCYDRWDEASQLLMEARAAWIKFQDHFSERFGGGAVEGMGAAVATAGLDQGVVGENTKATDGDDAGITMAQAQENIASARIALHKADVALKVLQAREDRRARRIARRQRAERLKKTGKGNAAKGEGSAGGSSGRTGDGGGASGAAGSRGNSGGTNTADAQDQNQWRGMSLLDKIIAAIFSGIPLGQRIPFEVFCNLSEKSQEMDIPLTQEEHFRVLLEAQLHIRHEWEADFGYVPLHEFDQGVESGTDSDSDGKIEEPKLGGLDENRLSSEDSGSDGWRARGGGVFIGAAGEEDAPDPDDSDFGYANEGGEFTDDDGDDA
jgi:hypothetical protein